MASLTMVSRVLGFLRDLIVARLFGAGMVADAFFVAFRVPNLLRSLLAEGALSAGFVPIFSEELRHGRERASRTLRAVATLLGIATVCISLLGIVFAEGLVSFVAPGFQAHPEKFALCVTLTRIMLPYIACVSLVALMNGALASVEVFGISAIGQVAMNIVLIIGALAAGAFDWLTAAYVLAWAAIAGGVVQVVIQLPTLRRNALSIAPVRSFVTPATIRILKLMFPAALGAAVYQLSVLVNTVLASLLVTGSVSWLFYADRVTQFPVGIFSIALASVLLPALASSEARGAKAEFESHLVNSLRFSNLMLIPLIVFIFFRAELITRVLFERGAFGPVETINTAAAIRGFAFGVWATSCYAMVVRGFIAKKDTRTPLFIASAGVCLNVLTSLLLMGPPVLQEPGTFGGAVGALVIRAQQVLTGFLPLAAMGHTGLAFASSISAFGIFGLGALLISRRVPSLRWREFVRSFLQVAAASAASALLLTLVSGTGPGGTSGELVRGVLRLGGDALLAAGTAGAVLLLLRNREFLETIAIIRRTLLGRRQ